MYGGYCLLCGDVKAAAHTSATLFACRSSTARGGDGVERSNAD
jgi:hypothetical protein